MKDWKKVALIQWAFDIINRGHFKAFEYIKSLSDDIYLIVALNTNELIKDYKKRDAVLPRYQKKFIIENCRFVDEVIASPEFSPMKLLKRHDVDVYVLTEERKETKTEEIAYMEWKWWQVAYSPRFPWVVPTSKIKEILLKEAQDGFMW